MNEPLEPLEPPLTLPTGLHHSHEKIYQALSTFAVFVFQNSGALGVFTRPLNMHSVTTVSVFVCPITYVTHYDITQEVSSYCSCTCSLLARESMLSMPCTNMSGGIGMY